MLQLIMVRHGETKNNNDGRYCGWNDQSLTEKGRLQVKNVKEKLKGESIDCIITSDLNRTMETAKIINENYHIKINPMKNLREMNFGLWEGLSYEEIKKKDAKNLMEWEKNWMDYSIPNGESLVQMYERVTLAIDEMIHQYKRGNILIVSHGGCIRAILSYLIGRGIGDYWKYKINNCGIARIEIIDDFKILTSLNQ